MKRILVLAFVFAFSFGVAHADTARDLTIGSRGEDVAKLQSHLIASDTGVAARSLAAVGATGYFGALTRAALAEFQAARGITPALGYYGPKTRAVIGETASEALFTGIISVVDTGCFVDAACTVTVGGKTVILLTGMRILVDGKPIQVGELRGVDSIGDLEKMIGREARVYAAPELDGTYTLYGKSSYYVEVLGKLPANGKVTLQGSTECLPAKDPNGPVIKLCAMGLYAEDGRHYALTGDVDFVTEGDVIVTGTFTKDENAHPAFLADGTIAVESVTETK